MCKLQEPTVQQLQQVRMSKPQSSQLIHTIFGSSDEEYLTTPEQAKMQQLEKRMMEPQVLIQGSNKLPKGKKTVNPKAVTDDPPYAGDELRVIPPQPTVPTNLLMPGLSSAGQLAEFPDQLMSLPSYEEMTMDDMFNGGPRSMETQPDLAPVQVLEEGAAVTQDGRTVEWWSVEEPVAQTEVYEYFKDENRPLHTNFVLPKQGQYSTCLVFFGSVESKQIVAEALCNGIHTKILHQWGILSCECGLVPKLLLSPTPRNKNKVFLGCPREARCGYFQWIHQAPKPNSVPKTATRAALKKRLNDMVSENNDLSEKAENRRRISISLNIVKKVVLFYESCFCLRDVMLFVLSCPIPWEDH